MNAQAWLAPQDWRRDTDHPCVSLGPEGSFDDMHVFAPCVAYEDGEFHMWYSGSRGQVAGRVFRLGLATSEDGVRYTRHPASPVFSFGDEAHSILTPTLLRNPDGSVRREDGKLQLWFTAADLRGGGGRHTLRRSSSEDGVAWEPPSAAQLEAAYAPTVLHVNGEYRLWYTDVSEEPWCFRHARSSDGWEWEVDDGPAVQLDQAWERGRLFYPTVLRPEADLFLMWYGSYLSADPNKTALGLALSEDGVDWHKHPDNPVFGPDEARVWESHYTTSQSVLRLPDGTWRIWYAARTAPPFTHKYFAIGTARWTGPENP